MLESLTDLTELIGQLRDSREAVHRAHFIVGRLKSAVREAKGPPLGRRRRPEIDEALDCLWTAIKDAPFDQSRQHELLRIAIELDLAAGPAATEHRVPGFRR
jgi:hypothetical protein